ncbi:MAG: ABC transporter permease [Firmicutes bacterium]|nr:ABC transporter permease [Bacillota bacterium]MCR4724746.1 ABC transporter permease [Clostridia bacterium]MBQ4409676.1 ABC transporter permease [Bacillota bacterium]MBQ6294591.1 ABC transporter permease [Bacillota bacterium]MBR0052018.1 ABC transporter permease [Bacillota bacterium]
MTKYIVKKLGIGLILVVAVTLLVFSLLYMMPGNPIDIMTDRKVSAEKRAEMVHQYGFDQPLHVQYVRWMKKIILDQDFGQSVRYKVPVWNLMRDRIPRSVKLCGWSLLIEMLLALPLGLLAAIKKDSFYDRFSVNFTLMLTSMPSFWLGALLILIFAVGLKWFPISGFESARNYVLPVAALTAGSLAGTLRLTRAEVLEVLNEKYVTTALAKGLPYERVMFKHVLRNALIMVTVSVFMSLPWLISGAVVTEKIFGIPGMGNLLLNSIVVQDFPVVQAVLLLIAILTVICNLLSDIVIAILDPRIRIAIGGGDK